MTQKRLYERQALGLLLGALGALATGAGARGVARGTWEVVGTEPVPAAVDSEYRFYAAWYLLTGATLLRVATHPETARREVRTVGAGLWTAAAGRVLSLQQRGRPTTGQLLLLSAELALPVVLVPWQARVAEPSR